ncbi:Uncharacterized protein BP5553_08601 [Venustampulla echinocandica]|uniref:Peptidase M20 dimerisation domain-containing protein n=1 Tax=Venustampulla echinocandica TaxID=2656787 RepID=A0A370TEP5_9HELO|nr:Uncharacterized protein BP5553_08601 [Venustampulla echinocandica]RDL33162.1 Uncharacterized protein BP5553_08601 [Venustampulla echinocandica]
MTSPFVVLVSAIGQAVVTGHTQPSVENLKQIINDHRPKLDHYESVYKNLHSRPELGCMESETAGVAAEHLKNLGFEVHEGIGGHGLAGVFKNGSGRTILLRADMDALAILEETGLSYASRARMIDDQGVDQPVSHACGHDTHVTCLMAAATLLHSAKSSWKGTLICLFQPDEEHGAGAQAMVDDGLYKKIPKPDIVLGQHVTPVRSGVVATRSGPCMSAADSFNVTIFGRGGHGSQPQNTVDPVLIASHVIIRLQSIVSREVKPGEIAVITCGSIHGGGTGNVIPDQVDLKLNIRTYTPEVRSQVLASMKRIIESECEASGAERKPVITATDSFPLTDNDQGLTDTLTSAFQSYFGADNVWDMGRATASEDVSILATSIGVPYSYWNFGGTDEDKWEDAVRKGKVTSLIPGNHSSLFAPVIEPTLRTGIDAISLAALTFLT